MLGTAERRYKGGYVGAAFIGLGGLARNPSRVVHIPDNRCSGRGQLSFYTVYQ